jgi:hypothetical protein
MRNLPFFYVTGTPINDSGQQGKLIIGEEKYKLTIEKDMAAGFDIATEVVKMLLTEGITASIEAKQVEAEQSGIPAESLSDFQSHIYIIPPDAGTVENILQHKWEKKSRPTITDTEAMVKAVGSKPGKQRLLVCTMLNQRYRSRAMSPIINIAFEQTRERAKSAPITGTGPAKLPTTSNRLSPYSRKKGEGPHAWRTDVLRKQGILSKKQTPRDLGRFFSRIPDCDAENTAGEGPKELPSRPLPHRAEKSDACAVPAGTTLPGW